MRRQFMVMTGVGAVVALMAALAGGPAVAGGSRMATGDADAVSQSAEQVRLMAGAKQGAASFVGSAQPTARVNAAAATFQVTYHGFTPAARTAFRAAVNIWARRVSSTVPITVDATFTSLPQGALGAAGSSFIWRDFAGAPKPNTWYADAIANKRAGEQLDDSPDIRASFNSDFTNWYFGTNGVTPAGKYDFESVVLHELGHGLGFAGGGRMTADGGALRTNGLPMSYDRFTENGAGTKLLTFADNSAELGAQLTSDDVFFDSVKVRNANGGQTARLYAPATWKPGSSYSHLDEETYPKGDANSLMTPMLNAAEAIHSPGRIAPALLRSIGW